MNLLVSREVSDSRPVTVTYSITDHGKGCIPIIKALYEWGEAHRDTIIKSFKENQS